MRVPPSVEVPAGPRRWLVPAVCKKRVSVRKNFHVEAGNGFLFLQMFLHPCVCRSREWRAVFAYPRNLLNEAMRYTHQGHDETRVCWYRR